MYQKIKNSILLLLCFTSLCSFGFAASIKEHELKEYVRVLSSDKLKGRRTGTEGEQLASGYLADLFLKLGLKPAGTNHSFFQEYSFVAGKTLGVNNSLSINYQNKIIPLILNKDWIPLSFSQNTHFKNARLVFVGYGISTPQSQEFTYDSYKNLDVKNKWVLVLNEIPPELPKKQKDYLHPFSSLRYKAFTAKEHGAKGIVFINEKIPLHRQEQSLNAGIAAVLINKSKLDQIEFTHKKLELTGQVQLVDDVRYGRNVLGKITGKKPNQSSILVGAHFDHLGQTQAGETYSGADDNASGIAAILAIAQQLTQVKSNKDIIIAAWSGEELGLLGSNYFINQYKNKSQITAVINLDMVGHLEHSLIIQSLGSSDGWLKLLETVNNKYHLPLVMQNDPYLPTDSTSFYLAGIPVINFFTGASSQYHTINDKSHTLNYKGINSISKFIVDLVFALDKKNSVLTYKKIIHKHYERNQHLNIYLGTIPDYSDTKQNGVQIAGVKPDSPAEKAGLKSKDIIIKLNQSVINDIYDYTYALNGLTVGKQVPIVVLRQGKKTVLKIAGEYKAF